MRLANRYLLAIDAGGSGVRCLITDLAGHVAGQSHAPWTPSVPPDLAPTGKEIDPGALWRLIGQHVRRALRHAGIHARNIAAVSATSQRQAVVFLDAQGRELYAGPNSDARAFFEGQAIDEEHGEEIYNVTGHTPALLLAPAKLRWFQANGPEVAERTRTVLTLDAWIAYRLSGERACERAAAAESGLADISDGSKAAALWAKLRLSADVIPALAASGQRIGAITRGAAAATGLAHGTPVVAAGPDTQCALLGMGVLEPGVVGVVAGSTAPVQMALDRCALDEQRRTWSGLHVLPGRWVLESTTTQAGAAYDWLVGLLGHGRAGDSHRYTERLIAKTPAGASGALAFLGPRLADMRDLSPRWGGILFPVPFIEGPVEPGAILRASAENFAFAVKGNVAQLESITGRKATAIWACGGLSRSHALTQILADALEKPMHRPRTPEASALGAAMAAATSIGAYRDLTEAARGMGRAQRIVQPDAVASLEYQDLYRRWLAMGDGLKKLSEHL